MYFKSHLWQMKRDPIKTPFLSKNKETDYNESLAIFKLILRFMNDDKLSGMREKVTHINTLIGISLKNELYFRCCVTISSTKASKMRNSEMRSTANWPIRPGRMTTKRIANAVGCFSVNVSVLFHLPR